MQKVSVDSPVKAEATVESGAQQAPKPMTPAENVILTIKILVVAGIITAAIWVFDRFSG